jgi:hypothetical protein
MTERELLEALRLYGAHLPDCQGWCVGKVDSLGGHGPHRIEGKKCSCGLDAALGRDE